MRAKAKDLFRADVELAPNSYAVVPYEEKFLTLVKAFAGPDGSTLRLTYSEAEVAVMLFGPNTHPRRLARMRSRGESPPFVMVSGRVFYRLFDLLEWIHSLPTYHNTAQAMDSA